MTIHNGALRVLGCVAPLLLAGCAVGPDFQRPAAPSVQGYTPEKLPASTAAADAPFGGAQHFDTGKDIQGQWWQLLHSPMLDTLVAEALKSNPTLTAAQAALREAQENVADSLRALQADANALNAAVASERAASRSLDIVRRQLELGQVAYLALLNAQTTYQQARLSLVQAEANRLADTAALFQALGGGWWNRTDVATASYEVPTDVPR